MKTFTITDVVKKGFEVRYSSGQETCLFGRPINQRALRHLEGAVCGPVTAILHWLDAVQVDGALQFDREKDPNDRRALVLVATAAGEGGRISFLPNTMVDRFNAVDKRVYRVPHGVFPPPGIEVLGERKLDDGSEETLLMMYPGASFRIHRTGDLQGAAPQLKLCWDGSWTKEAKSSALRTTRGGHRHWGMHLTMHGR